MPILLKKIDGSIISLFGSTTTDFSDNVRLIRSIVGEVGVEDYIKLTTFEGFVQDFSSVIDGEFCDTVPINFGVGACANRTDLNISY